jgi:hyperosmotically inducible periplasmic protein
MWIVLTRITYQLFSTTVLFLTALLLTSPAFADRNNDQQIQQDVEKSIQSKKDFQSVSATTEDQIVTLTGTVNLYIDLVNLEKRVKRIKNVDGVRNHVTVSSNAPDEKLREVLGDKLAYDRVGYGVAFNALTLEVKNGVVTLGGNVHDYPSRDSAVALAETTPGVKDVIDNIEVAPNSFFDDELRQKLYRAIYRYPTLQRYAINPAKPIRIVVDNGHVTLYGVVDNPLDKQLAGNQANSVPGVFSVDNQLIVSSQQTK